MTIPAIDPAALRLYYLQQLGVAVYVPRLAADAELPAAQQVEVESPVAMTETPAETASVQATSAPRVSLRSSLEEPAQSPAKAAAVTKPVISDVDAAAVQTMAPFQLLFAVIDARVAVALQVPVLGKPALTETESKLLHNLLRWLGVPPVSEPWLQYRWPLPGMPAGSVAAAGKGLTIFLQQALSNRPAQHLLVLGSGPVQCLQQGDGALTVQGWLTHGLSEMLAVPTLKREVWQQLLPLHAQLRR
ncbi:MAG TPA: hypothetical protein VMH83_07980 [Candidatus Acidoferrum sp.]|nr:hypothetical protein [Candidatus Acidoferrum sp.]